MRRRAVMKKAILIIFISAALYATALAAGKTSVLVGYIESIEKDYIIMNDTQFKLINTYSDPKDKITYGFETEYWLMDYDRKGNLLGAFKVNFETLGAVGWVAEARVTLQDNVVRKIEVLDEEG
jgi:hypothetical protein